VIQNFLVDFDSGKHCIPTPNQILVFFMVLSANVTWGLGCPSVCPWVVITENSVRSENTGVPIIREMMVATTMSALFVALIALVASSFRTRDALQAEIVALRHDEAWPRPICCLLDITTSSKPRRLPG
jgi:hypothetical protein